MQRRGLMEQQLHILALRPNRSAVMCLATVTGDIVYHPASASKRTVCKIVNFDISVRFTQKQTFYSRLPVKQLA